MAMVSDIELPDAVEEEEDDDDDRSVAPSPREPGAWYVSVLEVQRLLSGG